MSEQQKWKVVREHEGDRSYKEGDVRTGTKEELGHLSPKCLEPLGSVAKEASPVKNKAEPEVQNKSEPKAKTKAK